MSLLYYCYKIYDNFEYLVGEIEEGKEPLVPIGHILSNSQIEIQLNERGDLLNARLVNKKEPKIIIPATIESADRTSTQIAPHPLQDFLKNLIEDNAKWLELYLKNLKEWNDSKFSHPKIKAVLNYIQNKTILEDLQNYNVIKLDDDGMLKEKNKKNLVRFMVSSANEKDACWEDKTLFKSFTDFYTDKLQKDEESIKTICYVTGKEDVVTYKHTKGLVLDKYGAKLVSGNDDENYTFRGRFAKQEQAYAFGYIASQKAHNALRWLISEHGVGFGGKNTKRHFICCSLKSNVKIYIDNLFEDDDVADFTLYKQNLSNTLQGYRDELDSKDRVFVAGFEAITKGRLSVTYYNEFLVTDFLDRIEDWYSDFYWKKFKIIMSPSIWTIISCSLGRISKKETKGKTVEKFEVNEKIILKESQVLLQCIIESKPIPIYFLNGLVAKSQNLHLYDKYNKETLLFTTCAVIKKYRKDKFKEEWTLALDENNKNISYRYGRLLAIAEKIESDTYVKENTQIPNAMRMQNVFSQRPAYGWGIIHKSLEPYFSKLKVGSRIFYKNLIGEILSTFNADDLNLNKKLEDIYILGYYHQRSSLYTSSNKDNIENKEEMNLDE